MIDGRSGATRWRLPMLRATGRSDDGIAEIVAAPDLDGDGVREVITESVVAKGNGRGVYVDGISGKGGRRLWWKKVDVAEGFTHVWAPGWWGRGPDGWPLFALPMGGEMPVEKLGVRVSVPAGAPVVHLLEASTGQARHAVTGLARAGFADLDGDGLIDLWGEANGELRAVRGEAPEAWRVLGRFERAGFSGVPVRSVEHAGVDFDGDGVPDTLNGNRVSPATDADGLMGLLRRSVAGGGEAGGVRTAVARSGRDGRTIWKCSIDRWQSLYGADAGRLYNLRSFPLPGGDLNGDGTPDVIASVQPGGSAVSSRKHGRLPIEVLSGRTGARVWSAGSLPVSSGVVGDADVDWVEPCVVEPHGAPDLIAGYSFGQASRLARVSGRDGRIIWDVAVSENAFPAHLLGTPVRGFDDLDGDGGMDAVVGSWSLSVSSPPFSHRLVAVSLRDGKMLWSHAVGYDMPNDLEILVGDVNGDKRADVVCKEGFVVGLKRSARVRVLDGRDGKACWSFSPSVKDSGTHLLELADFEGNGVQSVCLNFEGPGGRRVVVFDGEGKERGHRDFEDGGAPSSKAADLDGDGRDELLVSYDGRVHACDRDLKELWSWPSGVGRISEVVSGMAGRQGEVILAPGGGFDAKTGQRRWTDQVRLVDSLPVFPLAVLDRGDSRRVPLLVGSGSGATVCRVAVAMTAGGAIAPARGDRADVNARRERTRAGAGRCPGSGGSRMLSGRGALSLAGGLRF